MTNFIENVKSKLIEQKLTSSEEDFCRNWLARNRSYLRVLRCKRLEPSMSTLLICADRLGYYAQRCEDSKHVGFLGVRDLLRQLEAECKVAAAADARGRWQGYAQI